MMRMTGPPENNLTELLVEWHEGDSAAFEKLSNIIYPELRRLARMRLRAEGGDRLSTTELVHEVYLRLVDQGLPEWKNRGHFFGIVARLMRQVLVDEARERNAQKRGAGLAVVSLDDVDVIRAQPSHDVLALNEALQELARSDPRKSRILELRYFGGLEGEEIAAALDVSPSTVARELRVAKAWLKTYLSR